ncbi:c-type cytochrome [Deinococcus lacus]|uniref:C-type cytochrome n=1 Tax=Deinococcus lacus TaxID=392561 RepID=A0ABW1YFG1_9DEIO
MSETFSRRGLVGAAAFGAALLGVSLWAYHLGGSLAGTPVGGAELAATPAAQQTAPNGESIYVGNCASCHGAAAAGGMGPELKHTAAWSDADFAEAVLHGKAQGRELAPVMPRFESLGIDGTTPPTEAQLQALHAYLKGL